MKFWHRWKGHKEKRTPYVIEYENTGYDLWGVRVECSCGKVWAR